MLAGGPVSWDARKQRTVELFSKEAEGLWLCPRLSRKPFTSDDLKLEDPSPAVIVHRDNVGTIGLAENPAIMQAASILTLRATLSGTF